jgi:molybdopterin synthase catalytic subunit
VTSARRADETDATIPVLHVRVRLFAVQREIAGTREIHLELPPGATVDDAWEALVGRFPALAPGRPSVRFAVNGDYADAATPLSDRDELACIPPVSGGAGDSPTKTPDGPPGDGPDDGPGDEPGEPPTHGSGAETQTRRRILELRDQPFSSGILTELTDRIATPEDGAVVGFLGRTRITPGTPAPGQEAEARRHRGRDVESLEYEAHESMALRMLGRIADEVETRFAVSRIAIVHRTGEVPLGEVSVAIVAASPHRDAAFLAAKYAIDETKGRVPIWKAERFADGHVWIGEPAREHPPEA